MGYTLVYDSDCGVCTRFRNVVSFLDPKRKMRYTGIREAVERGTLDPVPAPRRWGSFHLVAEDGSARSGAGALSLLAAQLPGGFVTSRAIDSCPMVSRGATFAYTALSRLHGSGACSR